MFHLPKIILASGSPRRAEILTSVGWEFEKHVADIDETEGENELPEDYVVRLAKEKALAVAEHYPEAIVLGADTTVVCDGEILGKPTDAEDAKRMLRRLSGRTHQVLTGIAAATRQGVVSAVESTEVVFSNIREAELERYCATREPLDKAGAYGIQGYAARWIPRIDGDYFNVMGLPIARVVGLLRDVTRIAEPV